MAEAGRHPNESTKNPTYKGDVSAASDAPMVPKATALPLFDTNHLGVSAWYNPPLAPAALNPHSW